MSLARDEQRYEYADYIRHRFPYIINICYELYQKTGDKTYASKAFEYAEKSKASLLLSTVRGVDAYKMHLVPGNLKKEEDRLWTKTELASRNLSREYEAQKPNLDRIDQLNNTLYKLKHQQDSLILVFKKKYPTYYNARYNADVMSAGSLQKALRPNDVMLQYSLSDNRIVIFLLSKNELKIFNHTLNNTFYADLQYCYRFISGFSAYNCLDTAVKSFERRSNNLYNVLIKPLESYIAGKHLIIIPDGELTQIPFEILVATRDSCSTFQCMSFLVRKNAISYEYSGTLFGLNNRFEYVENTKLLAMAPNYKPGEWKPIENDSTRYVDIPGTFDEIKNICKTLHGKPVIKRKASERNFKKMAANYNILHLAMHGMVNNKNPMLSNLVFIPGNDSVDDGLLNAYEIAGLPVNAQLVVLSACNTGYGKLYKGEGIISLARAFYAAGAKSVVMTLWAVSDKTSSCLVSNFYNNLASQQYTGDALRKAKLDYMDSADGISAHPYFWAGYIVTGNQNIIFEVPGPRRHIIIWILPVALILIAGLVYLSKKYRARLFQL
jgi:CHAT domain-containing protein